MAKEPAIRIGVVHIIESLRAGNYPTGDLLHGVLTPIAAASKPPISVHFWREATRTAFLERLRYIAADVRRRRLAPVLQFETHGSPEGLHLTSGEWVTWADLKPILTEINVTCRLNLLVLVAACNGLDLTKIVEPNDRAPLWGLIGPKREVTAGEIEDAHSAFYRTLFASGDGGVAWRAMNAAIDKCDSPFQSITAEFMFREVMRTYFRVHCSDERIAERASLLATTMKDHVPQAFVPLLPTMLGNSLRDYPRFFDQAKERFFLYDLCPEHSARFPVSLDECLSA